MKIFFLTLLMFLVNINTISAQLNKLKLDSLFDILEKNNKAMSSIAISKNGKIIYENTIGYSCYEDSIKSNSETKYRIGSITKMFTSIQIFKLIEQKKLTLNTLLSKYYPKIPNSSKITIEQLLYHRSGIYDYTQDSLYFKTKTNVISKNDYVKILETKLPYFTPDSTFMYSNSNYILLGYIIEEILNCSYEKAINDNIISKLNLKSTYCGSNINCKNNESLSYEYVDSYWTKQQESNMTLPGGAGRLVSTPKDLTIFIDALFSNKLISQYSLKQMMTLKDGAGMGIFSFPFYEKKAFGHTGSIDSYHSMLTHFISDSLSIAYCSNGEAYPMNDVLIGVLNCCFNKKYSLPNFEKYNISNVDLNKYTGVYFNSNLNMNIKITLEKKSLIAQATGQPSFPLELFEEDKFKFEKAGVVLEFNNKNNIMLLIQNGAKYPFKKMK